jgi:predicted RNase H-like HicB family nuclease
MVYGQNPGKPSAVSSSHKAGNRDPSWSPAARLAPQNAEQYFASSWFEVIMRYLIVVERGPENFSAYAPDLPGCVAAADTEEETISLMKEALALHIEDMRSRGEEIPEQVSFLHEIEIAV